MIEWMNFETLRMVGLVLSPMTALVYAAVTGAAIWRGLRLTPLTLPVVAAWVGLLYAALVSGSGWFLLAVIVSMEVSLIGWIVYLIQLARARMIFEIEVRRRGEKEIQPHVY